MKVKRKVYTICAVIACCTLAFTACSNQNRNLEGTWEKTAGEIFIVGIVDDFYVHEDTSATLTLISNGDYIATDETGYIYSDKFEVADENYIVFVCNNNRTTFRYSIDGDTLVLKNDEGESTWQKSKE